MVTMEALSRLAKKVMDASVDAQLLGLIQVSVDLGRGFEEVVRVARELELAAEAAAVEKRAEVGGDGTGGR